MNITLEQAVRTVVGIIGVIVGNYLRKNAIPIGKQLLSLYKMEPRVDVLENTADITRSELKALYDISYDPTFKMDLEGNMEYANPAWAAYTGFENVGDAYGKGFMDAIPANETDRIERISERIVEHPSSWEGEVRMSHMKTQEPLLSRCRTQVVYDKNEKPVYIIGRLQILKA